MPMAQGEIIGFNVFVFCKDSRNRRAGSHLRASTKPGGIPMLDNVENPTAVAVTETANAPTAKYFVAAIGDAYAEGVEAVLKIGGLLNEARAKLRPGEFSDMVECDLPFGQRTAERLMKIAANPVLTNPTHVSALPPAWGTLHALSQLPQETLETKIADGTIHPEMERKKVEALKAESSKQQSGRSGSQQRPDLKAANEALRAELAAKEAHIQDLEAAREQQNTLSLTAVRAQYAELLRPLNQRDRTHELKELQILIKQTNQEVV
jgi:hypothetical protein